MMTSKMEDKKDRTSVLKASIDRRAKDKTTTPLSSKPNASISRQRNMGNRYIQTLSDRNISCRPLIQRKCACGGTCASCAAKEGKNIQTKLKVGASNDHYEKEADQVASQIMRMPDISRQSDEEEEAVIQPKIQRISTEGDAGFDPGPDFHLSRSGGQALSAMTRQFMEPRFGIDFTQVRIHNNAAAHESAAKIQAKAYTYDNNIWLGKGTSESDKGLMAHELTHVVQQSMASGPSNKQEAEKNSPPTEGVLQRKKNEVGGKISAGSGFSLNPKKGIKNKFGFSLEIEVPLLPDKKKTGPVAFFKQLKISAKGSTESEDPFPLNTTRIETLEKEIALTLASIEMKRLQSTRFGNLSFGVGADLSAGISTESGPEGVKPGASLAPSANLKGGFQSRPLLLFGKPISVTAGLKTGASAGLSLEKPPGIELKAGASVGLRGQSGRFIQATLSGSAERKTIEPGVFETTGKVTALLSVGGKF